mmetsp:Transcript_23466/g.53215  ORF Transcript_23466/g.53215 Transcript_23466/m.53215 type:complete len:278 (+) Transcript_23466:173-1006(+)
MHRVATVCLVYSLSGKHDGCGAAADARPLPPPPIPPERVVFHLLPVAHRNPRSAVVGPPSVADGQPERSPFGGRGRGGRCDDASVPALPPALLGRGRQTLHRHRHLRGTRRERPRHGAPQHGKLFDLEGGRGPERAMPYPIRGRLVRHGALAEGRRGLDDSAHCRRGGERALPSGGSGGGEQQGQRRDEHHIGVERRAAAQRHLHESSARRQEPIQSFRTDNTQRRRYEHTAFGSDVSVGRQVSRRTSHGRCIWQRLCQWHPPRGRDDFHRHKDTDL